MPTEVHQCLYARDMDAPQDGELAHGRAVWYTHRSPDKATDNEDSLGLFPTADGSAILAVADGLGGHANGAAASRAAIESLQQTLQHAAEEDLRGLILDAIDKANQKILQTITGSATTLAVVELHDRRLRTYHIGDTTILVTGQRGKRKLLTTAHSPVGYAVESGMLDESEAVHHEERHLVSNVVGCDEMSIEIGTLLTLAPKDTLLIASDGLFDNLYLEEVVEIVRRGDLLKCGQTLVKKTRERMRSQQADQPHHPDDLSFILYRSK